MSGRLEEREIENLVAKMRGRIAKNLVGFSACSAFDEECSQSVRLSAEQFPVPELLPFTLGIAKFKVVLDREEKVRWTVFGSFEGNPFCIERRKMGVVFEFSQGIDQVKQKRIFGQLRSMLSAVRDDLKKLAMHQVHVGEVCIANRYYEFNDRYSFFRDKASAAYNNNEFVADPEDDDLNRAMKGLLHDPSVSRSGFYFAVAMVDVFFSRLEHLLILHFAFLSRWSENGDLERFMTQPWKDRFKELVDIDRDEESRKTWAALIRLKETIRNPFAHGGNENDFSSIQIPLPWVGLVPASLNGFKESPRASGFFPIEQGDFEEICKLLDRVDELMQCETLKHSFKMIEGGLDAAFTVESQEHYEEAIGNPDQLDEFIDAWNQRWMDYVNYDY